MRLSIAARDAREAIRRTQELDPNWRAPTGLYETVEGEIRHNENVAAAARARYNEITTDAIPGTNPSWGANRLRKELGDRGYLLAKEARGDGLIFENPFELETWCASWSVPPRHTETILPRSTSTTTITATSLTVAHGVLT